MKLPLDDKPSLKELFDSKKFDQPDSEFWDSFQDEVRSKTLSSVVTQKVGPSITKIASCVSILIVVCTVSFRSFFPFSGELAQPNVISSSEVASSPSPQNGIDLLVSEKLFLISSTEADESLDLVTNSNLLVEQNFHSSSLETTFQQRVLPSVGINSVQSPLQFTF